MQKIKYALRAAMDGIAELLLIWFVSAVLPWILKKVFVAVWS